MPNFKMPYYNATIHEIMQDEKKEKEAEERREKAAADAGREHGRCHEDINAKDVEK